MCKQDMKILTKDCAFESLLCMCTCVCRYLYILGRCFENIDPALCYSDCSVSMSSAACIHTRINTKKRIYKKSDSSTLSCYVYICKYVCVYVYIYTCAVYMYM
jgi:hypothetical protein